MKSDLYKRLFKAIYREDIVSLKKIALEIIKAEQDIGHKALAESLEQISIKEKPQTPFNSYQTNPSSLTSLPKSNKNNLDLLSYISHNKLKHNMVLPENVEQMILSIEQEYLAQDKLKQYNLEPKRKILLYGAPGCGKTMSAERIAWDLGLPLVKVRFDSLLSAYFGESASNLRQVFDYCKNKNVVLLIDEFDFIAKSREATKDVGEVARIVNMLLTLLDEYDNSGLVIATTNLKTALDKAIFRRFDEIIEIPLPGKSERKQLLEMVLNHIPMEKNINLELIAEQMIDFSATNVVLVAQKAAKMGILSTQQKVTSEHFAQVISSSVKI